MIDDSDEISRLKKRIEREKKARLHAENLLEEKTRNVYEVNRQLHENTRLLQATVINARDAVLITTADFSDGGPKIIYANEAFANLSGYTAQEVIGKSPSILQGPDTDKRVLKELREKLVAGQSFQGELKNYTKNGVPYWLEISITPVRDENGHVTHFTAIERDVTERKMFEKELTINREAAEVANRAKDNFLANMSHELRTPMNGIIGLSELLLEMNLNGEQKELAGAVNVSSRNLLFLLNDILDLSKIEAGELTLEHIIYNTRRIVGQTVNLLKPVVAKKGINFEMNIDAIVPEFIMGDPARLQQIMNNLVTNAIKFTDKGFVRLDVTSDFDSVGDAVLNIRVEDTGIGIPEDKQDMIFNKFTQADVSTARKYGGTGLGLAITRELVEMMGGFIDFESVEGTGTIFHVEIPVAVAEQESVSLNGDACDKTNSVMLINTDARVLVVDDHPVNLLFMRKVLKKLGFDNADEAYSGRQALELAEKTQYDLIFMDCQMPEMDGFEASAYIREIEDFANQVKIIAVTADAMKGAREKCIDAGMNDYISKPVDVDKLRGVLGEWLPGSPDKALLDKAVIESAIYDVHKTGADICGDVPQSCTQGTQPMIMDWERLALFTDGDASEEQELIGIFSTYAQESLDILRTSLKSGDAENWKKAAHKFKGSAANLGAYALSEACLRAEEQSGAGTEIKISLLQDIEEEYAGLSAELSFRSLVMQTSCA